MWTFGPLDLWTLGLRGHILLLLHATRIEPHVRVACNRVTQSPAVITSEVAVILVGAPASGGHGRLEFELLVEDRLFVGPIEVVGVVGEVVVVHVRKISE